MRYRITKMNVTQGIDWLGLDLLTALTQLTVTEVAFTLLSLTCSPSFFFDFSVRTGVRLLVRRPVSQRAH